MFVKAYVVWYANVKQKSFHYKLASLQRAVSGHYRFHEEINFQFALHIYIEGAAFVYVYGETVDVRGIEQ